MSLFNQGKPSRMRSVYGRNTTNSIGVVYTINVDVEWFVASASYTSHFLHGKSLAHSDYISFPDIDLILQAGDKIQVQPSSGGHLDTIVTVTETFIPVG